MWGRIAVALLLLLPMAGAQSYELDLLGRERAYIGQSGIDNVMMLVERRCPSVAGVVAAETLQVVAEGPPGWEFSVEGDLSFPMMMCPYHWGQRAYVTLMVRAPPTARAFEFHPISIELVGEYGVADVGLEGMVQYRTDLALAETQVAVPMKGTTFQVPVLGTANAETTLTWTVRGASTLDMYLPEPVLLQPFENGTVVELTIPPPGHTWGDHEVVLQMQLRTPDGETHLDPREAEIELHNSAWYARVGLLGAESAKLWILLGLLWMPVLFYRSRRDPE